MPLIVYCCVTYCPSAFGPKTQDHWTALHFVNAVKGTPLAGYAYLPLRPGGLARAGDAVRIDRSSANAAPLWFARLAVHALPWRDFLPVGLVPLPDAACDLAASRPPHTLALADALTSELGADVATVDALRWARPMPKAHSADGSRDSQVLYGRLRVRGARRTLDGRRVVLVDDVVVTGAHLRAAAAFLTDCGAHVACAICAVRATDEVVRQGDALTPSSLVLPDFQSDPDWLLPGIYDGLEL